MGRTVKLRVKWGLIAWVAAGLLVAVLGATLVKRYSVIAAPALIKLGVRPGDRVCYLLGNGVELVELYFGIAKTGAISAGILPRSVGREIAYIVNDLGAKVLFVGPAPPRSMFPHSTNVLWTKLMFDRFGLRYSSVITFAVPPTPEFSK